MRRCRSTATMMAARHSVKLNEPFDPFAKIGGDWTPSDGGRLSRPPRAGLLGPYDTIVDQRHDILTNYVSEWETICRQMNADDTVVKFFGSSIANWAPARYWFNNVQKADSHEIFILLRNNRDRIWSHILANKFGYVKKNETSPYKVEFSHRELQQVSMSIENFLRFYPVNGKVVTFETLPEEFFDYSTIGLEPQNAQETKMPHVTNPDFVEDQIYKILTYYSQEWYEKIGTDIFK